MGAETLPIISPWAFYAMSLTGWTGCALCLAGIVCFVMFACFHFYVIDTEYKEKFIKAVRDQNSDYWDYKPKAVEALLAAEEQYSSKLLYIAIALFALGVLIPDKDTCKEMIIASYVTPANIKLIQDEAQGGVDYIFNKIQDIVEKRNSNKGGK